MWILAQMVKLGGLCLLLSAGGCIPTGDPPPVVSNIELGRYTGKWYEIARYPVSFQEGCYATTAEYMLRPDGRIGVLNTCREGGFAGRARTISGTARIPDPAVPAKLKVSFFGPFEGDYWILALDRDYRWAVVSEPGRRMLWILSRTPTLDDVIYAEILERVTALGYDTARLLITPQES
jgi:apolipoprotein D and lipocalin family protein